MSHLQVFPQNPAEPSGPKLRVWNSVEAVWELEDVTDAQVLEALEADGAARAHSSGMKAIARARLQNPAPPA